MNKINIHFVIIFFSVLSSLYAQNSKKNQTSIFENYEQLDLSNWKLIWQDEFDYSDKELDKKWISQNGPTEHVLVACSRWRENAVVQNGILELVIKKETRGGQDWTAGNVWTKKTFGYGYFEARYKYAAAPATNNSFWLWPKFRLAKGEKACEVDINEGHFPSIINTNVHNWTDFDTAPSGRKTHSSNQLHHTLTAEPLHEIELKEVVKAKKIRLLSTTPKSIQISELRIFGTSIKNFPNSNKPLPEHIENLVASNDVTITTNGNNSNALKSEPSFVADNRLDTRWVSRNSGDKWIEFEWDADKEIKSIQFINGWLQNDGMSRNLITDYKIQVFENNIWKTIYEYNLSETSNFGEEYHTYGLEWDEDYFKFYFDGKLYYTMRNMVCFSETNILFSLAILKNNYSGPITDKLIGTSMKIDYVRYYKPKKEKQIKN